MNSRGTTRWPVRWRPTGQVMRSVAPTANATGASAAIARMSIGRKASACPRKSRPAPISSPVARDLLTDEPFYADDYALHAGRAAIVAAELPRTGRLFV